MSKENSTKNIRTAFFLNLAFAFVELIGGIITNSVAILSDAVHDFGDSISLAIAWALQKKSNKAKDDKYSYGYKRFSLLSSVILSGILLVGSILILVTNTSFFCRRSFALRRSTRHGICEISPDMDKRQ